MKIRNAITFSCLFSLAAASSCALYAQVSNEWINFNQSYYRITTSKDGIYKLTYSDLQTAGFPVGSVDPRRMQLFHRGVEQAMFVQGQADAVFNPTDYLEFFGQRNNGERDAKLYKPSALQPHNYYNIYSDTTAYFLTWNLTTPGKRMSTFSEVNVTNIPSETSHNQEKLSVITDQYSIGYTQNDFLQYTQFDQGEGWTGVAIRQGESVDYVLDQLTNQVQSAGLPQIEVLLVGRDNISHAAEIYIGPNAGTLRLIGSPTFFGFETPKVSLPFNWSDIGADGKVVVRIRAVGSGTNRYQFSASYLKVSFPQDFNLSGASEKVIRLNTNILDKSYVELDNPGAGFRILDITDRNNVSIIGTQSSGIVLSAIVPGTQSSKILYASNTTLSPFIKAISFRQINPANHDYLIVTHSSLLKPAAGYSSAAKAYAGYRASPEGGSYDTLVVTMDQLYNQFNYGETSALAIYEFVEFMVNGGSPRYLFLMGKGRDPFDHRNADLLASELKDLVPSAGVPGSDMAFSAGLNGTTFEPALPTGRLTASEPEQVAAYLNKIKEVEASGLNQLWRKQGLHLSGGIQPNELVTFRFFMDGFKSAAEDIYWGGKITTIGKRDPSPVELISIAEQINDGLNLVTFFGHSSPGTIDLDIGYVSNPILGYDNPGKYPVFLINGCNAGNFFSNGVSFGEDWMLATGKGARGFMAHSSFGLVSTLKRYNDLFYSIGFNDSTFLKKGLGDIQQEVARQYLQNYGSDMTAVTQAQQMVLLGDPAVQLFGTATPDYETNDSELSLKSLDGNPVTALSDSFAIDIKVKNFGAGRQGELPVRVVRTLIDNTKITYDSSFSAVLFHDTLQFKIKNSSAGSFGNNLFEVIIDPLSKIKELSKSNNKGTLSAFIPLNGTQNLFPAPYGIVSASSVNLLFQITDPLSDVRKFHIEIDTSATFNSAYLRKQIVDGKILANYQVNLLAQDSTVYYWRTKLDQPGQNESKEWATSSFTFISGGSEGWAQTKFPQLLKNNLDDLVADLNSKKLKFVETLANIAVKTFGSSNPSLPTDVSLKINGDEYNLSTQSQPCRNNTINIIAFDKKTLVPYSGLPFTFQDPRTCGREPQVINSFTISELETGLSDDIIAMVDAIKTSDSVAFFSIGDPGVTSWSSTVKSKLNELGILEAQINSLQAGEPFVILGRKGAPAGTAKLFKSSASPANAQELQVSETITGRLTSGTMNSVLIGPASKWNSLVSQAKSIEASDQYSFSLTGLSLDGKENLLQASFTGNLDLSSIDAKTYPYLKLQLTSSDEVNLSPVQLKRWIILYDPVAEGLLIYKGPRNQEPLQEGESWKGDYKFVNISSKAFTDSLRVDFSIISTEQQRKEKKTLKIKAPLPGDSTLFSFATTTAGKAGPNDVDVFVNPKIVAEQYYENNVVSLPAYLNVLPDKISPVLSVKIDGRQIINGDFVSSNPLILISVKDENKFLIKTDTIGMKIFFDRPCSQDDCPTERIFLKRNDIKWFPGTLTSDFKIEFRPTALPEGEYKLIIEATDVSGNKSGLEPYEITFQVKNETTLTFQSVFPNPSSSHFNFNFVVTGNNVPDEFTLVINSIDGATQQRFDLDDITDFHIGTNTLFWEPRDSSGNSLPAGLYLFRMKFNVNGQTYSNSGKLVLVR